MTQWFAECDVLDMRAPAAGKTKARIGWNRRARYFNMRQADRMGCTPLCKASGAEGEPDTITRIGLECQVGEVLKLTFLTTQASLEFFTTMTAAKAAPERDARSTGVPAEAASMIDVPSEPTANAEANAEEPVPTTPQACEVPLPDSDYEDEMAAAAELGLGFGLDEDTENDNSNEPEGQLPLESCPKRARTSEPARSASERAERDPTPPTPRAVSHTETPAEAAPEECIPSQSGSQQLERQPSEPPRGVRREAPSATDSAKRQRRDEAEQEEATAHCENDARMPVPRIQLTPAEHEARVWLIRHYGSDWRAKLNGHHHLMLTGDLLWCRICGHHTTGSRAIKLKSQCTGEPPPGSSYATYLKHLKDGRHPKTRAELHKVPVAIRLARMAEAP